MLPSLHPHVRADAEHVLAEVDSWTAFELAPLLPKLRNISNALIELERQPHTAADRQRDITLLYGPAQ
jgi:hypothetical protein